MRRSGPLVLALACLLAAASARASNPRISLRIEDATLIEVAKKLSEAAGVNIQVSGGGGLAAPGLAQPMPEKYRFDWSDATLAQAMRELCRKANLRPGRTSAGYHLYASGQPPLVEGKRMGLVQKAGVELSVRSVSLEDRRTIAFNEENFGGGWSQCSIQFNVRVLQGSGESVKGIENLRGMDDQGVALQTDASRSYSSGSTVWPDEWTGVATVTLPAARARKIAWLEGDLIGYRSVQPTRIEIPLPLEAKVVKREAGELTLIISRYSDEPAPIGQDDDEEIEGLPRFGGPARGSGLGPRLRVRAYYPSQAQLRTRSGYSWMPTLVDKNGSVYSASTTHSSGWGDGRMTMYDTTAQFPRPGAAPARLVWEIVEFGEPYKICSFRMTDIPLPPPGGQGPRPGRPAAPPAPPPSPEELERPFFERGGGILVARTEVAGTPAAHGRLQIGLAEKTPGGWGPTRWFHMDVDGEGMVTVRDVRPGEYRVTRRYQPDGKGPEIPRGGRWEGGETTVRVTGGAESRLAPLRWLAGEAPPRARAPVKK